MCLNRKVLRSSSGTKKTEFLQKVEVFMKRKKIVIALFKIFAGLFCVPAMIFFTAGCADPWKKDVPDFEICYMEALGQSSAKLGNRNYLMWWTLLGILPWDQASFSPEKEAVLTGREQAPGNARFHHFLFQKKLDPALKEGEIHFSPLFAKYPSYRQRGRFYGCITLKVNRTIKDAVLIAASEGDLKVWINGVCRLDRKKKDGNLSKVHNVPLRNGFNRIVLRYTDPEKFDPDNRKYSLRFTGKEGNPMFVR